MILAADAEPLEILLHLSLGKRRWDGNGGAGDFYASIRWMDHDICIIIHMYIYICIIDMNVNNYAQVYIHVYIIIHLKLSTVNISRYSTYLPYHTI